MTILDVPFNVGDMVVADNDYSLPMTVTGLTWRGADRYMVECSYFAEATGKCAWVESWRLTRRAE